MQTFLKEEKPALVIQISARGDGGTLFGGGAQNRDVTDNLPTLVMAAEHYNRIVRLIEHEIPVKLQFEIKVSFDDVEPFNVIAELPGNSKKDELVMVGGHFDSWHYGTGATDNAAGSAIAMEVMRTLKSLNLNMDRTVRMALWGGEEEGLLGSRAYVKEHFADPATMKPTAEHEKVAGYWNIDNGTGKIRGIYLQGNDMVPADLREVARAVQGSGRDDDHEPQYRRHGPPVVRRRGPAGLPVHPGHDGLQHADAPLQHGRVRPHPGDRHDADVGHGSVDGVPDGGAAGETAAQAAASSAAAGRGGRGGAGGAPTRRTRRESVSFASLLSSSLRVSSLTATAQRASPGNMAVLL